MQVMIPTKGRHHRQLKIITELQDFCDITLVVEPQDVIAYQARYPHLKLHVLQENDQGIPYARNAIIRMCRLTGKKTWMIDDDVTSFVRYTHSLCTDDTESVLRTIHDGPQEGVIAGMCFAQSMREEPRKDLTFSRMVGNVYLLYPEDTGIEYREDMKIRSDITFILQHILAGHKVVKYNHLGFRVPTCGASGVGGCTSWYEDGINDWLHKVADIFPDIVTVVPKMTGAQGMRCKINWKEVDRAFNRNVRCP